MHYTHFASINQYHLVDYVHMYLKATKPISLVNQMNFHVIYKTVNINGNTVTTEILEMEFVMWGFGFFFLLFRPVH